MHQQILFFDIDGTLTSEIDGSIPASVPVAFREAQEAGHLLFLCSGRCYCHIEERLRKLEPDGIVCGCGTNVITKKYGEMIHHRISAPEAALIRDTARENGIDILYESAERIGFDPQCKMVLAHVKRLAEIVGKDIGSVYVDPDQEGFTCDKVCIFTEDEEALKRFTEKTGTILTRIDRGGCLSEMVPKGYSKATGIELVLQKYGIIKEDSWGFGDSNNDLAMLKYVGHPVVMGNARPEELKRIAEYVVPKASEDGIMVGLKELGFFKHRI